jgi:cysteinyl-tRNA synthetase
MDNDLGTPAAVAELHRAVRDGNAALETGDTASVRTQLDQVQAMLDVLGLRADSPVWARGAADLAPTLDGVMQLVLAQRAEARARKDFVTSDAIRDTLAGLGITVEDTPDGARWTREGR